MSQVSLVWITPDAEKHIAFCARVSNPSNQENPDYKRLLSYCKEHGHWSVFEMASACLEINAPRDISRQILRHRSFSFQEFCISGDSLIKTSVGSVSIEDLYEGQTSGEKLPYVKVYDEDDRIFKYVDIVEVFDTGFKPVYEIKLSNGRKIKATKEHKFLTKSGFKRLKDISVGDLIGVNGIDSYKNKEWLALAKEESLSKNGLDYIASKAGVSTHTIRKWLRIHGLQYTKKEVAKYTSAWNKGLPPEVQPMFGKVHEEVTRQKMRQSSKKGYESNFWDGGVDRGFRQEVWDWQYKYKNYVLNKYNQTCVDCGCTENLEIDHILPVKTYPELAFELDNLQVLCSSCHKQKSSKEFSESPNYFSVVSIEYVGEEQTYDMEVNHHSHNYVANGIVTHNSQRYAEVDKLPHSGFREARLQDYKNRQNSIETFDTNLSYQWEEIQANISYAVESGYQWALDNGIAKECARVILPEGLTPSRIYMSGTIRSWMHYVQVREGNGTQKEHVLIAKQVKKVLADYLPNIFGDENDL